ncbi:MAG TPA: HEAT repeat domain-containing protein [Gemmatimonadota bacterium]|nr:HEAT repeat domain-containing protein [Gemmatimonadota bacterium]
MMESAIVAIIVKATLVLLAAFGLTPLLRRASASARHAVWSAALIGVIAVPALTMLLPWRIDVLPSGWELPSSDATAISAAEDLADTPMPTPTPTTWNNEVDDGRFAGTAATPYSSSAGIAERAAGSESSGFFGRLARDPWRLAVFAWLAIAVAILLRILAGMAWMWRLARRAEPLSGPQWLLPLGRVTERLDLRTAVRVVKSDAAAMPVTCGVLRPAVVLPEESDGWSEERREAVLLHELAHVRRGDLATHLIARVACALYWFHPLAWIAARRLRHESERACDDLVLGAGTRASEYAAHLLDIVRSAGRSSAPAAAVPMAQRSSFEGRLLAILEPGVARHAMTARRKVALATGLVLVVLPLAAMAPSDIGPDDVAAEVETREVGSLPADRSAFDPSIANEKIVKEENAAAEGIADGIGDGIGDGVMVVGGPTPFQYRTSTSTSQSESRSESQTHTKTKEEKEAEGRLIVALSAALDDPDAAVRLSSAQALGSLSDPRAVEALLEALRTDPDAGVRKMAAWALGEIESPAAVGGLSRAARSDESVDVRAMAVWALGEIESPEAVPALGAALRDSDVEVRRMAVWALGEIESPEAVEWLTPALDDGDVEIRRKAAWALGEIESPAAVSALGGALRDSDAEVRATAAWALGEIESPSGVDALRTVIRDSNVEVRRKAVWALGEIQDARGVAPLTEALSDSDRETRKTAVWALGEIQDPSAVPALRALLDDPDAEIRDTAIWALLEMDDASVYDVLVQLLEDEDPEVRRKAAEALGDM